MTVSLRFAMNRRRALRLIPVGHVAPCRPEPRRLRPSFCASDCGAGKCWRSSAGFRAAGDHAQEDAIPAHEVMMERRADMRGHQTSNGDAEKGVDVEKLLGERAVLGPDRRQLEPAEDDDGRKILKLSGRGYENGSALLDLPADFIRPRALTYSKNALALRSGDHHDSEDAASRPFDLAPRS